MNILVTGGAGSIGSHTVKALLAQGHNVVVIDNLSRGHRAAVPEEIPFYVVDIHDIDRVQHIMEDMNIDAVMHFAAHSQVGESMENPTIYYDNNVVGSYSLLEAVRRAGVKYFVFSSTAAVYGEPEQTPITEDMPYHPTNVYGQTKLMIETMLAQFSRAYGLRYVALALLQCGRGRWKRHHRGRPYPGNTPHPLDPADGPGPAGQHQNLRHRLSHARRHLHP